ncbi:MAG: DUF4276 family protein [Clostridiaceae bacterium]|jgi:hypothetical protein|nr:hypothetical protein [Oscillospiraceae bacterium]NLO62799.1 DUF4276 family protein [Clostridiaceae bacterium]
MRFEVLTEDRSGAVMVSRLMSKIIDPLVSDYNIRIRPHRGRGDVPSNPYQAPKAQASGLLDLLPAKLRAYDRVFAGSETVLVVIMDSDYHSPGELRDRLISLCRKHAPALHSVVGLCVEETESWLIGDKSALMRAYPEANMSVLDEYRQDSVCGTWEILCRSILGAKAERVIRVGYPAIGQYKHDWAQRISEYMEPDRNASPSFQRFRSYLSYMIEKTLESHGR